MIFITLQPVSISLIQFGHSVCFWFCAVFLPQLLRDKSTNINHNSLVGWECAVKRSLFLLAVIFSATVGQAEHLEGQAASNADDDSILWNTYSNGYRLGVITKPSYKGIVIKSNEITMQVGQSSGFVAVNRIYDDKDPASNIITDKRAFDAEKHELVSPWMFSAYGKDLDFLQGPMMMREFAIVHYIERACKNCGPGMFQDSHYLFVDAFASSGKPFLPASMKVSSGSHNWYSDAPRGGRIVKVSHKGKAVKSWEMQLEEGSGYGSSNSFISMTIPDPKLARYAILVMMTGLPVKIHYTQALIGALRPFSDTMYDVYGIEFAPGILERYNENDLLRIPPDLIERGSAKDIDNYVIQVMRARPER